MGIGSNTSPMYRPNSVHPLETFRFIFYRKAPHPMILEVITAVSIYSGALAYLASDSPEQDMTTVSQPKVEMNAASASSDLNARAGLRSFTTDASGRIRYAEHSPTKHESIWAKDDGKFEDWAK